MTRLPKHSPHLSRAARRAAAAEMSRAGHGERDAHHAAAGPRRSYGWWIAAAAILVIAGAAWWAMSGRSGAHAPAAPLLGQQVPDEGFDHVAVGSQIHYKANPPVSGPHYPFPAPAGVYPNGLQTGFWVHSLEHGYIVVLYRPPASPERLAEFDRMVKEFPKSKYRNVKLLIVPYSDMPHPYAVLAWDWRLEMDSFDRATVLRFYKEHVDHGREDIP